MRRRHVPLMLLLLAGCGGTEEPLSIAIDTTALGLDPALMSVKVRIYVGEIDECTLLYVGNKGTPVVPLYESYFSLNPGADQGRTTFTKIRPSKYMIGVWGYDPTGAEIAYGCAPSVAIEEGVEAKVMIGLSRPPGS